MSEQEKKSACKHAETLERAGHYEEAAFNYELLAKHFKDESLLDKARELRDKACGLQINVTSVNVNRLIEQLKESGGAVTYDCPNCGGSLKINGDTISESLDKCNYCGSKIVNLPKFIKEIVS